MIRKAFNKYLQKRGLHIIKPAKHHGHTSFQINEFSYDLVKPSANYSPWQADRDFNTIYEQVKSYTLVDVYRCYELWELAAQIHKIEPGAAFIEIGVWRGGTAAIIGNKLSRLNASNIFYLADTFEGVPKSSAKDTFYFDGEHKDTSEQMVHGFLADKYGHYQILKGIFPEDTSHNIPAETKFGFCHIDVDVYNSAKDIVNWIWDKLIPGGVIVFDDYGFHYCDGITRFVNELKQDNNKLVIHNLNGHAIVVKTK